MKIVIAGANSTIAKSCIKLWAKKGSELFLIGRKSSEMQAVSEQALKDGAREVSFFELDFLDFSANQNTLKAAINEKFQHIDLVFICYGTLPDQKGSLFDVNLLVEAVKVNGLSTILVSSFFGELLREQGFGKLAVVSSVAGDRGRSSNYIYGASKSLVSTFLSGMLQDLHSSGVSVLDIKPGFIDTKMTRNFNKSMIWISPDRAAKDICKSINKNKSVIYIPWFWRYIMMIIRNLPNFIFKRLKI
tara:strand:- start:3173 stop:3910 length:738 start_codon:yes stop_codon:yes gene_type:complete